MPTKLLNKKIAVIGAGISGLSLAKKLSEYAHVTVFDKSRGIGGRMATRRSGDYHFDHGAQFFTAKSKAFQDFCYKAESDGMIQNWNPKYAEISEHSIISTSHLSETNQHFVAKPQMNSVCKYLAKDLDVKLNKKIESIHFTHDKWRLHCADEEFADFDYLILAIPSPQAAALLPKTFRYYDRVANVTMLGCFTLMIGLNKKPQLDFDVASVKKSILSWIAVNNSKPERPDAFSLLVNSSNQWAESCIEEDLEVVKANMMTQLCQIINLPSEHIDYMNLHRWRYANAHAREGEKSLFDENLKLGICGDWLISGKVESAYLSGIDLCEKLT